MSLPDVDGLLDQAARDTGLADFGELPYREALEALHYGYTQDSGLPPPVQSGLLGGLVSLLAKRLKLVEDRRRHPKIAQETVEAPLVVVGLPRTGSTHLHALLATKPGARAPLQWEMNEPSPPPMAATFESDPRIAKVQQQLDARPNAGELMKAHPFGATRPEQCIGLIDWSFINFAAAATCRMPSYLDWFLNADHRPAYEHHFHMLQHLQYGVPGEWVLKWPKHLFSLPERGRGFVFVDGVLHEAEVRAWPHLVSDRSEGEAVLVELDGRFGTEVVEGVTIGSVFSTIGADGRAWGVRGGGNRGYVLSSAFAGYTWRGESAIGQLDRSAPRSSFAAR